MKNNAAKVGLEGAGIASLETLHLSKQVTDGGYVGPD